MKILTITIYVTMMLVWPLHVGGQTTSLKQQMELLKSEHDVSFAYDSSLEVRLNATYHGPTLHGQTIDKALRRLFLDTDITWKRKGRYVLLRPVSTVKRRIPAPAGKPSRRHTLSGYVRDESGEPLINATVALLPKDAAADGLQASTTTNAYGFYSLTLPEGTHRLRFSFVGCSEHVEQIGLTHDRHFSVSLRQDTQLQEVIVTEDLNSPVLTTQTGKHTLTIRDLQTEFALMSSPDLIKQLQRLPGVSEGIDVVSGMYVHGGNDDENLFLLDGTSMYTVNHALGLFSAFNTDVVKNVDFYKSGFPARYGGRLSSVTDVRTRDGDRQHTRGSYSIGLIDGRFQLEGPIKSRRERKEVAEGTRTAYSTSYNFGLRRTWADLVTEPILFLHNKKNDEHIGLRYFLHDLNAKLTHAFSQRDLMHLSIYSSKDMMQARYEEDYQETSADKEDWHDLENNKTHLTWGNLNISLDWQRQCSPRLFADVCVAYTYNRSLYEYRDDWRYGYEGSMSVDHMERTFRSTIHDVTLRSDFDYRPTNRHHVRFGGDATAHDFRPHTLGRRDFSGYEDTGMDTIRTDSRNHLTAQELNLYAEDELLLTDRWSLNAGLRVTTFHTDGKTFFFPEPRLATKFQLADRLSLKLSYTEMTQAIHRMSNTYLSMPTDYWVPTTSKVRPMHSRQVAAGLYSQVGRRWTASLEGYYKLSHHMLQYTNYNSLTPPAQHWDRFVTEGKGRFYGMEARLRYLGRVLNAEVGYTLSWNQRHFDEFYSQWFYDKFDNRHKLNAVARLQLGRKAEMYAGWTFHTGYRMTMPTQYVPFPDTPDGRPSESPGSGFYYEQPNNVTLPDYHRLDLGFNLHHTTKHGHERVWNISIYNAYCRLNAMYAELKYKDNSPYIQSYGFVPVIPTASYTIKF